MAGRHTRADFRSALTLGAGSHRPDAGGRGDLDGWSPPSAGVRVLSALRLMAGTVGRDPAPLDLAAVDLAAVQAQAALTAAGASFSASLLVLGAPVLAPAVTTLPGPSSLCQRINLSVC